MKIVKAVLALLGLAGLIAAGVYLGLVYVDNERLLAAANSNKSGSLFPSPMPTIWIATGIAGLSGLLIGIASALPLRTPAAIRRATLDELEARRPPSPLSPEEPEPTPPEGRGANG